MIVIGSNEKDMVKAANNIVATQGGMVVVSEEKILSSMPLQMAGIVSTDSFETVSENFANPKHCISRLWLQIQKTSSNSTFFAVSCIARYTNTKYWIS